MTAESFQFDPESGYFYSAASDQFYDPVTRLLNAADNPTLWVPPPIDWLAPAAVHERWQDSFNHSSEPASTAHRPQPPKPPKAASKCSVNADATTTKCHADLEMHAEALKSACEALAVRASKGTVSSAHTALGVAATAHLAVLRKAAAAGSAAKQAREKTMAEADAETKTVAILAAVRRRNTEWRKASTKSNILPLFSSAMRSFQNQMEPCRSIERLKGSELVKLAVQAGATTDEIAAAHDSDQPLVALQMLLLRYQVLDQSSEGEENGHPARPPIHDQLTRSRRQQDLAERLQARRQRLCDLHGKLG